MRKILLVLTAISLLSCNNRPQFTDQEVCELLLEMEIDDQKYRHQLSDPLVSKGTKDSLGKLQSEIDHRNTALLIEIIDQKGWPQADSLNCEEPPPTILILRHAPTKYFDTIQSIIDAALVKGNIDGLNHMFIENHLKGRPDFNFEVVEEESL